MVRSVRKWQSRDGRQAGRLDHGALFLLALHPQMGRRLNHRTHPELRTFPVAGFVILYRVTGEFVRIVHVIRGRRDIDGLLAN